jgi:hypothetical protein
MPLKPRSLASIALAALAAGATSAAALGQGAAYSPYADSRQLAPVAPDGTIRWGTFYKTAAIQQKYEYLWSIGACRGTAPDIVATVNANKLEVDALPETEFIGTVRGVAGGLAGGVVAFAEAGKGGQDDQPLVAQLHPAGVTRLAVSGRTSADILRPGLTVRFATTVDAKGFAREPLAALAVITPPQPMRAVAVVAKEPGTVVGTVTQIKKGTLAVRVNAGRIRTLSIPLAADAVVTIDATAPELAAAGDTIKLKGRLWTGEGAMGAGTVFASDVSIHKAEVAAAP